MNKPRGKMVFPREKAEKKHPVRDGFGWFRREGAARSRRQGNGWNQKGKEHQGTAKGAARQAFVRRRHAGLPVFL